MILLGAQKSARILAEHTYKNMPVTPAQKRAIYVIEKKYQVRFWGYTKSHASKFIGTYIDTDWVNEVVEALPHLDLSHREELLDSYPKWRLIVIANKLGLKFNSKISLHGLKRLIMTKFNLI